MYFDKVESAPISTSPSIIISKVTPNIASWSLPKTSSFHYGTSCHNPGLSIVELSNLGRHYYQKAYIRDIYGAEVADTAVKTGI